MNMSILAILSALFGCFCIWREIVLIVRRKQIRISNLFFIIYGLTYGIILALLLVFYKTRKYQAIAQFLRFDYSYRGLRFSTCWFLAAIVGYLSCKFGTMLRVHTDRNRKHLYAERMRGDQRLLNRLQITSLLCMCIGIVCFFIWVEGWGGYSNLFLNAAAIRNGSYGIRNKVAFFAKPAQIVATVSVISIYLLKREKNILLNRALLVVSFLFSLLYYLAKDGRMAMAMYLLIVLFMTGGMFERQENIGGKFGRLAGLFLIFVFIVLNMTTLTSALRGRIQITSNDVSTLESIMSELTYIYVAGQTSVKKCLIDGSPFLIGHDIGAALFAWVPSALTPKGLMNIWDYNTFLIAGNRATAQYPTDLISTSLYDLGVLGPILLPLFWGMIIGKLERMNIQNSSPIISILYYSLSMTLLRIVNYSMFSATVASVFHLFVAAVVYWGVTRIRLRIY